jgi:hypothetical protein
MIAEIAAETANVHCGNCISGSVTRLISLSPSSTAVASPASISK